jgi:hypothetical protein
MTADKLASCVAALLIDLLAGWRGEMSYWRATGRLFLIGKWLPLCPGNWPVAFIFVPYHATISGNSDQQTNLCLYIL